MARERRPKPAPAVIDRAGEEKEFMKGETGDDPLIVSESPGSDSELTRLRLRERWELASVLNFLNVFEPIIGSNLKLSAEEIEAGLVKPNSSLSKLHIELLKGIPPVSKMLNRADSWVTVLCKKLAMWWRWVAEGEIPLSEAKGEEISKYKELDPTTRLLILKALCEIRADQNDIASYINDAVKSGTQLSSFCKDKIGADGNGTTYWYDGNTIIGHRLYREVKKFESKPKLKGKNWLTPPAFKLQWQTLATNLEEFRKVVDDFSCSKVTVEVAVSKKIEEDAIPILEKIRKRKEMVIRQQQRQEMLLNGYRHSYASGITRSCRNRRPVSYTYDEYDRAIQEAIHVTQKRKTKEEQKHEGKLSEIGKRNGNGSNGSVKEHKTMEDEAGNVKLKDEDADKDIDDNYYGKEDQDDDDDDFKPDISEKESSIFGEGNHHFKKQKNHIAHRPVGSRWSKRLAGTSNHPVTEARNMSSKNRSRQRPTRNTAIDSIVVPDSEDDSENTVSDASDHEENPSLNVGIGVHSDN